MPDSLPVASCHVCREGALRTVSGYESLMRVSSDAKPFRAGGSLAVCENCGTVQKPITAQWLAEVEAIYGSYSIYHNAGGAEQNVFATQGRQPQSRSSRLIEQLRDRVPVPSKGRLLDIGCGNGATLRAFSQLMPGWSLVGNEQNDRYRTAVEAIPQVEAFHVGEPETVVGSFDLLTLVHVLEHISDPVAYLRRVTANATPRGTIVAQVPAHRQNPFDLLVADHCTHFSLETLTAVFEAAGLEVLAASDEFVPRELTVVGRPGRTPVPLPDIAGSLDFRLAAIGQELDWLNDLARRGRQLAATGPIGVFGTSLGGAFLLGELGASLGFFVDEDPSKIGRVWDGRPILPPQAVPPEARVLLGLPDAVAAVVKARLGAPFADRFVLPGRASRKETLLCPADERVRRAS